MGVICAWKLFSERVQDMSCWFWTSIGSGLIDCFSPAFNKSDKLGHSDTVYRKKIQYFIEATCFINFCRTSSFIWTNQHTCLRISNIIHRKLDSDKGKKLNVGQRRTGSRRPILSINHLRLNSHAKSVCSYKKIRH